MKDFLDGPDGDKLEKVVFCTFVPRDVDAYNHWLPEFFPSTEPMKEPEVEKSEEVAAEESAKTETPQPVDSTKPTDGM